MVAVESFEFGVQWLTERVDAISSSGARRAQRILIIVPTAHDRQRLISDIDGIMNWASVFDFEVPHYNSGTYTLRWRHGSKARILTDTDLVGVGSLRGELFHAVWIAGTHPRYANFSEDTIDYVFGHALERAPSFGWDDLIVTY